MKVLYIFPILILYFIFYMFLIGFFICTVYSRYSKLRLKQKSTSSLEVSNNKKVVANNNKYRGVIGKINEYLYGLCRYYTILIGRFPSHRVRNFLMRKCFCMDISPKTVLYGGFEIRSPWNIHIGESVVGVGALLDGRKGIYIQDRVCLAQNVKLFTLQHDINDSHFGAVGGDITLEEYSWISSGTTVLPGINVGKGAVLASGAIATKDLEPYGVYAGIPAKKISERTHNLDYECCHGYWHFY